MGEYLDSDLLLTTAVQEDTRAREFRASQLRGARARDDRERALGGSTAARKALAAAWVPVLKNAHQGPLPERTVYSGEGPPPTPIPDGTPVGAWYMDELTGDLYRLRAGA